jgi:hypothetical protein
VNIGERMNPGTYGLSDYASCHQSRGFLVTHVRPELRAQFSKEDERVHQTPAHRPRTRPEILRQETGGEGCATLPLLTGPLLVASHDLRLHTAMGSLSDPLIPRVSVRMKLGLPTDVLPRTE